MEERRVRCWKKETDRRKEERGICEKEEEKRQVQGEKRRGREKRKMGKETEDGKG